MTLPFLAQILYAIRKQLGRFRDTLLKRQGMHHPQSFLRSAQKPKKAPTKPTNTVEPPGAHPKCGKVC